MSIEKNHNILDFSHGLSELEQLINNYGYDEAVPAIIKLAELSNDPLIAHKLLEHRQQEILLSSAALPYAKYIIRHNIKKTLIISNLPDNTGQQQVIKLRSIEDRKEHDRLYKKYIKQSYSSDLALYQLEGYKHSRKIKSLIKSSKNNPDVHDAQSGDTLVRAFTLLNHAEALHRQGRSEQAAHTLLDAISMLPTSADLWCAMARYLQALGNDEGAYEALFEALTYEPTHSDTLAELLSISVRTERLLVAERYISRLPDNKTYFLCLKADVLRARYDYSSAVRFYQLAYRINKKNINALRGLVYCFFALGEHKQCLKHFKELIGVDFNHLNNLTLLGFSLEAAMYCLDWRFINLILPHLGGLLDSTEKISGMNLSFCILAITDDIHIQKKVAQKTAALFFNEAKKNRMPTIPPSSRRGKNKIRIAYLSADIGDHIVTWLLSSYIHLLDKDKFEVYIYSYPESVTSPAVAAPSTEDDLAL
jgi:predicted O-linked N-acetylglucosamine transferase (SPINDLY family)